MSRLTLPLGMLLATFIGLMGCKPGTSGADSSAKRIKALESKCIRLEGDFRAANAGKDKYRRELARAEQTRDALQARLNGLDTELSSLRDSGIDLKTERDTFAEHVNRLAKELTAVQQERDRAVSDASAAKEQFNDFREMLRVQLDQAEIGLSTEGL